MIGPFGSVDIDCCSIECECHVIALRGVSADEVLWTGRCRRVTDILWRRVETAAVVVALVRI